MEPCVINDNNTSINVNLGILGHVDSGKTQLARALSTHFSTASLDKNPQSQARGMTLDLGFSCFQLASPQDITSNVSTQAIESKPYLVTVVDCPGHASLFKTTLGGLQIMDIIIVVVDVTKGLQHQTIESLLVAHLAVGFHGMILALNKIDLLDGPEKEGRIQQVKDEIATFLIQHWSDSSKDAIQLPEMVPITAGSSVLSQSDGFQLNNLTDIITKIARYTPRHTKEDHEIQRNFYLAIDHCFAIPGVGGVLTGTIISGDVRIGDTVEFPRLGIQKQVKGMHMFRKPVKYAKEGDRIALQVVGLDVSTMEREIAVTPHSCVFTTHIILRITFVPLFEGKCLSQGKFHTTIGHETVVSTAVFFSPCASDRVSECNSSFDSSIVYEYIEGFNQDDRKQNSREVYAFLTFDRAVAFVPNALIMCSRLDLDPKKTVCRLAFHGPALCRVDFTPSNIMQPSKNASISTNVNIPTINITDLRVGKIKIRTGGIVDKLDSRQSSVVIGKGMFDRDVDWQVYIEKIVMFEQSKRLGKILGPFGKSGKFRLELILEGSNTTLPSVGEPFIMKFIKMVVFKDKNSGRRKISDSFAKQNNIATRNRMIFQDLRILYPTAFAKVDKDNSINDRDYAVAEDAISTKEESNKVINNKSLESCVDICDTCGVLERLKGETSADGRNPSAIVAGLFESDIEAKSWCGKQVLAVDVNEMGIIEKPFGKSGKVRVYFTDNGGTIAKEGCRIMLVD